MYGWAALGWMTLLAVACASSGWVEPKPEPGAGPALMLAGTGMAGTIVDIIRIRTRAGAAKSVIAGTIAYREPMALPPSAAVQIVLADVSKADAAASTIAETTIETAGKQVPIPFELTYDPQRMAAAMAGRVRRPDPLRVAIIAETGR